MPVYRDSLDNIIGVVFVKDLVALPPGTEPQLTVLMRSAHFVPATKRASKLLGELQGRQVHMAIVVDEYGGTAGLVTVEDLLEENELIIPGTVFEFNGSYINAESILPGKSYWLRTFVEGFIIISSQNY